jgi:hypothetical protein
LALVLPSLDQFLVLRGARSCGIPFLTTSGDRVSK